MRIQNLWWRLEKYQKRESQIFNNLLQKDMKFIIIIIFIGLFLNSNFSFSQKAKLNIANGTIIVGGYVDNGGFLNFTGPGVKIQNGSSEIIIGVLPSLRFKKDIGITKNTFATTSLGLGITFIYKYVALQVPIYYNSKTSVSDGKWKLGIGIGIKLNQVLTNKKKAI